MVVDQLLATEEDGMTKKDYEVIARVFAYQMTALDHDPAMIDAVRDTAERMARELLAASKFNNNGNKSFKPDVFLAACGVTA